MRLSYEEHKTLIKTLHLIKNTIYTISRVFIEYEIDYPYPLDKNSSIVWHITEELDSLTDLFLEVPSSLVRYTAFGDENYFSDASINAEYCKCSERKFDFSKVRADLSTDYTFLYKSLTLCAKLLPEQYYKKFNRMLIKLENIKEKTIDFMSRDIEVPSRVCVIVDRLNKNVKKDDNYQLLLPGVAKVKDALSIISNYKMLDDYTASGYLIEILKCIEDAPSLSDFKYPISTKLTENNVEAKRIAQNILKNYADFWKKNTAHIIKICVDSCIKMFKDKKEIINLKDDYVKELFFLHTVKECIKLYQVMVVSCLDTISIYKIMHKCNNFSDHYIFNSSDVKVTFSNKKHLTSCVYLDMGVSMDKKFVFKGNIRFGICRPKDYKNMSIESRKQIVLDNIK